MVDRRKGADALKQVPSVAMSAEAIATDISRQGTAIGNTQVAQKRDLSPEEWTGAAADAASAEIQSLGDKVVTLSGAFSPAETALNTWAQDVRNAQTDVTKLQQEWDDAVADYDAAVAASQSTTAICTPGTSYGNGPRLARPVEVEQAEQILWAKQEESG